MELSDNCAEKRFSDSASLTSTLVQIVRNNREELRNFAMRLTGNRADADDLLQDALERAVRLAPPGIDAAGLRSWIVCVMRNRFLDQCRGRNAHAQAIERLRLEMASSAFWTEQSVPLWRQVDMKSVTRAIAQLPPPFRDVLEMSLCTPSQAQIAAMLSLQPATVRSRLLRARTRVRSLLSTVESNLAPGPEPSSSSLQLSTQ